jgi:hypothetical protein
MVVLEFRVVGKLQQYAALDEAIRTTRFIRNECVFEQGYGPARTNYRRA